MTLSEEILKRNIVIRIKINGVSMLPFIRTGDAVIIKPFQLKEAAPGDIVAFSDITHDNIICHRLIKKCNSTLIIKADNRMLGYEKVSPDALLGKVILIERNGTIISLETKTQRFLLSRVAWMSFYLSFLLVFIICFIEACRNPKLAPVKFIRMIKRRKANSQLIAKKCQTKTI